jgi:hypothetical protein
MAVKTTKKTRAAKGTKKAGAKAARTPNVLRCLPGYRWKTVGRTVALMRNNRPGVTLNCECETSGGCKVTIDPNDPQTISCLNSGCSSSCGWIINIPGIIMRGLSVKVARV